MSSEEHAVRVLALAASLIIEAAREAGELGIPSTIVYAVLAAHGMSYHVYQVILDALEAEGKVQVVNHLIRIPKEQT